MNNDWEELKRRAEAATPGPWVAGGPSFGAPFPVYCDDVVTESGGDSPDSICRAPLGLEDSSTQDMAYIAAANPAAILELIRQRDELLAALVSLAAVARRYLPDYDEHPEVQKADTAIANAEKQS